MIGNNYSIVDNYVFRDDTAFVSKINKSFDVVASLYQLYEIRKKYYNYHNDVDISHFLAAFIECLNNKALLQKLNEQYGEQKRQTILLVKLHQNIKNTLPKIESEFSYENQTSLISIMEKVSFILNQNPYQFDFNNSYSKVFKEIFNNSGITLDECRILTNRERMNGIDLEATFSLDTFEALLAETHIAKAKLELQHGNCVLEYKRVMDIIDRISLNNGTDETYVKAMMTHIESIEENSKYITEPKQYIQVLRYLNNLRSKTDGILKYTKQNCSKEQLECIKNDIDKPKSEDRNTNLNEPITSVQYDLFAKSGVLIEEHFYESQYDKCILPAICNSPICELVAQEHDKYISRSTTLPIVGKILQKHDDPQVSNDSEASLVDQSVQNNEISIPVGDNQKDDLEIKREKLISAINVLTTNIKQFLNPQSIIQMRNRPNLVRTIESVNESYFRVNNAMQGLAGEIKILNCPIKGLAEENNAFNNAITALVDATNKLKDRGDKDKDNKQLNDAIKELDKNISELEHTKLKIDQYSQSDSELLKGDAPSKRRILEKDCKLTEKQSFQRSVSRDKQELNHER